MCFSSRRRSAPATAVAPLDPGISGTTNEVPTMFLLVGHQFIRHRIRI
ncbi:MAG TPA: hypothetical protein VGH20_06420 [Myxococcales bacterium]